MGSPAAARARTRRLPTRGATGAGARRDGARANISVRKFRGASLARVSLRMRARAESKRARRKPPKRTRRVSISDARGLDFALECARTERGMLKLLFSISSDCWWIGWRFDSNASSVWAMCLLFSPPRGTELFSDSIHVIPRFFGLVPRERSPTGRAAHSPHSTPRVSRVDRVVANFARARTPEGAPPNAMHATGVTAARCVAALAPRCAFSLPLRFGVTTHFLTRAMRATSRASARTRRPRRRGRLTLGAPPLLRENADARRRRAAATLAFAADLTWRVRAPTRPEATIPSKPLTNCRCSRTFPSALSRRVTLRHCARPSSARPR